MSFHILLRTFFGGDESVTKLRDKFVSLDYLKGGFKTINIINFMTSLKCSRIKKLTQGYKP